MQNGSLIISVLFLFCLAMLKCWWHHEFHCAFTTCGPKQWTLISILRHVHIPRRQILGDFCVMFTLTGIRNKSVTVKLALDIFIQCWYCCWWKMGKTENQLLERRYLNISAILVQTMLYSRQSFNITWNSVDTVYTLVVVSSLYSFLPLSGPLQRRTDKDESFFVVVQNIFLWQDSAQSQQWQNTLP